MTRKLTFNEILQALTDHENELINLNPEQLGELLGDLRGKVDGVREWEGRLDANIQRVKDDRDKLVARIRTMETARKQVRDYLVFCLKSSDSLMIKGNTWDINLRRRKTIKPSTTEISSTEYLQLNLDDDKPVIKREYKWNIAALKSAYLEDPELYRNYVTESEIEFPQFTASKKD